MNFAKSYNFDHLVIGSGLAGLGNALYLAGSGRKVALVTKRSIDESNTKHAQGGIACVRDALDSFDEHVADTIYAGGGLCHEEVVRAIVEAAPAAIDDLIALGAKFTTRGEMGHNRGKNDYDLTREGGHTKRRILHAGDITGEEIERTLVANCRQHPNIKIFEYHMAIDLIISSRLGISGDNRCLGAYIYDEKRNSVITFLADSTTIACGGSGKVYLYTSNPDISCGDGVAMGYRAGAEIANMEFIQFHPTILYHPKERSFLISEAVRGEGGVLKSRRPDGSYAEFMGQYHPMGSLAPRDVVARAIDNEMKRTGAECVYIDITGQSEEQLRRRFPNIFEKTLSIGINMAKDLIPVVPAEHYVCGGIRTDVRGRTDIIGLYAAGESGCTGLHGANRLASNSLLEAVVVAKFAACDIEENLEFLRSGRPLLRDEHLYWSSGNATNSDELVLISHNWEEIRRFMWDFVGIYRTTKRLERAKERIRLLRREIEKYYWDFLVSTDLLELRNIATVAELIIDSSLARRESRGLHYNADYPAPVEELAQIDTIIRRKFNDD